MKQPTFLKDWVSEYTTRTELRHRMTERLGIPLPRRVSKGQQAAMRATMAGCNGCTQTVQCKAWLDSGGGDSPPRFCPIGDLLRGMSQLDAA